MATEASSVNGSSADNLTPAQRLAEKHDEVHNPTVEEVVDEEDIIHPPPSASVTASSSTEPSTAAPTPAPEPKPAPKKAPVFDTQSEELFPSLGASKSRASAAPTPWSRKPAAVGNANGINGQSVPSSASSRTSTPAPGAVAPATSAGAQRGISLPGRYTESIQFAPSQLAQPGQLKKPMSEVLRDINKRSKAKVEMSGGAGGAILFRATGSAADVVRQALKEVARQLGSKQSVKVPVPLSVRPHIIGRGGANITALSEKTGAKIQVPKQDNEAFDDDDDATIDVLIEGDAVAAEMARQEIEKIVNERTSSINLRLKDIPAEYYPFLAGAHNARVNALVNDRDLKVQIPHYHTWVEQAPAQPAAYRQPPSFVPQASLPIQISGDRLVANEVRAQLERQVEHFRRELISEQVAIERGRHQFIVGDRGTSLHDFLAETGCAVIMPPDAEDDEHLTIIGPADRIDDGMNKVMDLASSMAMASVDISRAFPNAPLGAQAHARNVTRYLQQRRAVQEIERLYDARVVAQPTAWEVYSRDGKNTMKARSDIMNLISGHPPARLNPVQVHPFYHQHLRQQAASQIRQDYGVQLVIPDDSDSEDEILLVYEGPSAASDYQLPRRQPAANETSEFENALKQAQQHILGLFSEQQEIVSRDVEAPTKFHDKIRRHVDREQSSLPEGQIPVQVLLGGARGSSARKSPAQGVSVRGPTDRADALVQSLLAFIEQEKQDELERGFTLTFDFPQKFANILIGKKGENIRKLREEFDVDIQVNDGKVELKGPQAKANACKAHILALGKKLEDEATYVLKVKPQFHKDLIGARGGQVNRLQDRYNVRINFPRSSNAEDETPAAEGDAPSRRNNQAPDEVVIKGPKKGADEAREELLNLLQYTMDTSHTATVSVAQSQLPSLIGSGGRELDALRLATGAHVDVPNNREAVDASGRVEVTIKGSKKAVEEAKKQIEQAAKVFDSTVTREMNVDKKHHRNIIGGGGSNIRKIVVEAGGPDDRQKLARMVRFPRAEAEGSTIRVEAHQAIADKIIAAIQAQVDELENQVTRIVEVVPAMHFKLIGAQGRTRQKIEADFGVTLAVPSRDSKSSNVEITGREENVGKAEQYIKEVTKAPESKTVQVPLKYHRAIWDDLQQDRKNGRVKVSHGDQQPPSKSQDLPIRPQDKLPTLTDDASAGAADDDFSWVDYKLDVPEGEIAWVLTGSEENVDKFAARVKKALAKQQPQSHVGFLILANPKLHSRVVGPGGSTINSIREKTGATIQVPQAPQAGKPSKNSNQEAIELRGTKEGIMGAKDMILEIINA